MTRVDNRVLLTGASGFVGRRLAPVLEVVGWHVRCVSRSAADIQASVARADVDAS